VRKFPVRSVSSLAPPLPFLPLRRFPFSGVSSKLSTCRSLLPRPPCGDVPFFRRKICRQWCVYSQFNRLVIMLRRACEIPWLSMLSRAADSLRHAPCERLHCPCTKIAAHPPEPENFCPAKVIRSAADPQGRLMPGAVCMISILGHVGDVDLQIVVR